MNVSSSIEIPTSITGPTTNSSWKASTPSSSSSTSTTSSQLPKPSFSERYQSEIAPPIKMKEYEQFASKYKEELLYESKQMTIKYHEELQETYNMESTITSLYSMMNDFITVLQSQEDIIIDIHDTSKKTTTYVKETDKELILTIDRSKSYQMTIVSMIIGLSLFLLLLDSLTP